MSLACRPDPARYASRLADLFHLYRPADAAKLRTSAPDAEGHHPRLNPPPLIRTEVVRAVKDAARDRFAPGLAAVIGRTPQPLLQAISDLESQRLVAGRIVLLGDAAFVARPHVAAGASKAALDAATLADALAADADVDAALARYERERLRFGHDIVAHGRRLGTPLAGKTKPRAEGPATSLPDRRA